MRVCSRRILRLGLLAATLAGAGCKGTSAVSGAPSPLEPAVLAERPGVKVYQPRGITRAVPLYVAVVDSMSECEPLGALGESFVFCVAPAEGGLGLSDRVRGTLRELASLRPGYIRKGPVTVFGSRHRTEAVFQLAGEEASFFAGLVLQAGDEVRVSNTRLFGYGQRGGKKVALLGLTDLEIRRIRGAAVAASLEVEAFPATAEGTKAALKFATVHGPLILP